MSRNRKPASSLDLHAVCLQCTGQRHLREGAPCQDSAFFESTDRMSFFGVADGQSGQPHSAEGAQLALQALYRTLRGRSLEQLEQLPYPDELAYELLHAVRAALQQKAAEYHAGVEEFASTLIFLAVDRTTGRSLCLHLGDGALLGVKTDGTAQTISSAENGWLAHSTWLTTSVGALSHLRISFSSLEPYRQLLLLTDGAPAFSCISALTHRARELTTRSGAACLQEALQRALPADDATCMLITLSPNAGGSGTKVSYDFVSVSNA